MSAYGQGMDKEVVQTAAKPALKKAHLGQMNSYDVIYLLDCSSYPQLKLSDLLSLPTAEVIKRHLIA